MDRRQLGVAVAAAGMLAAWEAGDSALRTVLQPAA